MDEAAVRERPEALCDALVAGDIERALQEFSQELRQNVGEIVSLLPLPASEATVESIEHSGAGDNVVLRLVGETDEILFQTRWKDRGGRTTMIELSHLSQSQLAPSESDRDTTAGDEATPPAANPAYSRPAASRRTATATRGSG